MNSAFPNKKNLAQKRSVFMTNNKFESKCLQKFYFSSKLEKECYMKTTSYLEEPNRHFCQHFMQRTTQQTFSAINLASQQKTTKLLFSSQVRKQFKLLAVPFKVSVDENFSTLLGFVFLGGDFWHEWVLNFILAEKENQKVLFNPPKMSLF